MKTFRLLLVVCAVGLFAVPGFTQSACEQLGVNCRHGPTPPHRPTCNELGIRCPPPRPEPTPTPPRHSHCDASGNNCVPDEGWQWIDGKDPHRGLRPKPLNTPHERLANVVWTGDGKHYVPQAGYCWAAPDVAKPCPAGTPLPGHKHVVWVGDGQNSHPAEGYAWREPDDPKSFNVISERKAEKFTNSQLEKIGKNLNKIRVPPPIPQSEVSLSSGQSTTGKAVMNESMDVGVLAMDLLAKVGDNAPFYVKLLLVAPGRTFIAGEDGAYAHLVKQDAIYEDALRYLKDPSTRREFAKLIRDVKEGKYASSNPADGNMLRAARAINDPLLGSSGVRIAWDAMMSPEAKAAMARKACLEIGATLVSKGASGILDDLTKRRTTSDAVLAERKAAMKMFEKNGDLLYNERFRKIIANTDEILDNIYRLETAGPKIEGFLTDIILKKDVDENFPTQYDK